MKTVLLTTQTFSEIVSVKAGTTTDYVQCPAVDQTHNVFFGKLNGPGVYSVADLSVYPVGSEIVIPVDTALMNVFFIADEEGYYSGLMSLIGESGVLTDDGFVSGEVAQDRKRELDTDVYIDFETFDCQICSGDIRTVAGFDSMILTLLFTDARASKDQVTISKKRRGWIGDRNKEIFRSRLWLKDQSRIEQIDLNEIEEYCLEALSYMTENNICSNIMADAVKTKRAVGVNLFFEIGQDVLERYVKLWEDTPDEA